MLTAVDNLEARNVLLNLQDEVREELLFDAGRQSK